MEEKTSGEEKRQRNSTAKKGELDKQGKDNIKVKRRELGGLMAD